MSIASPAAAFAWEFRRRHRWGAWGLAAGVVALIAVRLAVRVHGFPSNMDAAEAMALLVLVPASVTFTWFLAVFTFGLEGDLAARESMYPARLFTRPVTTDALAWWPMLHGAVACAALWIVARSLGSWPPSVEVPVVWPGILLVAHLAWTQALTWMPYPARGLRVAVVIGWLTVIDTIVLLALHFKVSEPAMVAMLTPLVPLAWPVARAAVARARRGDVPDWGTPLASRRRPGFGAKRRMTFRSPAAAQAWFEWRRNGWSLPVWVAALLPFELLLLWAAGPSVALVVVILLGACLTPVVMATFAAVTVSRSGTSSAASYRLSPFAAARPLTSAQLIAAKLRMGLVSTGLAWLLVIVAVPLALRLSGEMPLVADRWHAFAGLVGTPRATVFVLLVVAAFVAATWKQLVLSLYAGLTGRERFVKGSVFVLVSIFLAFGPLAVWILETERVGAVWSALPTIFTIVATLKMVAAVWIVVRLHRSRLVTDSTLVTGAALWSAAVFALYALLAWLLDAPHFPRYFTMLLAILAVPLARPAVAPLALAWNRHR